MTDSGLRSDVLPGSALFSSWLWRPLTRNGRLSGFTAYFDGRKLNEALDHVLKLSERKWTGEIELLKQKWTSQIDLKDRDYTTLDTKYTTLDTKYTTLDTKYTTLDTKYTTLQKQNHALELERTKLETQNEGLEKRIADLDKRIADLDKRNTDLEGRRTGLEDTLRESFLRHLATRSRGDWGSRHHKGMLRDHAFRLGPTAEECSY
jgi:predicted RNase H-like nuclease (RuvC/YqgF family)